MEKIQVFLDTDVVISALLSDSGASSLVIGNSRIVKYISNSIQGEITEVAKRLQIDLKKPPNQALLKCLHSFPLRLSKKVILKKYSDYVLDEKDSHVIAGAHQSTAGFLLTHNLKHYQVDKIKVGFDLIVMKPGDFLQYLRSLDS
jgi:putative PIN family toxin of toxin-antitoxin system